MDEPAAAAAAAVLFVVVVVAVVVVPSCRGCPDQVRATEGRGAVGVRSPRPIPLDLNRSTLVNLEDSAEAAHSAVLVAPLPVRTTPDAIACSEGPTTAATTTAPPAHGPIEELLEPRLLLKRRVPHEPLIFQPACSVLLLVARIDVSTSASWWLRGSRLRHRAHSAISCDRSAPSRSATCSASRS